MSNLTTRSRHLLSKVSSLEKKHKVITYASLLFLTVSTYFLRTENQDIKVDFATLQERNHNLKQNMVIFNRNYEDFPLPVWQKVKRGDEFIINYVNPEYLKKFGHFFKGGKYGFIGKNNFDLFPKEIAQIYYENDIAVTITGDIIESIEESTDKDGNVMTLRVIKWRDIKDKKDTLIFGMVKEVLPNKKLK